MILGSIYLLIHGAVKVGLVIALLLNKLWAYPCLIIVLLIFIGYQLYRIALQPSAGLIVLTIFDAVIVALTWPEIPSAAAHPRRSLVRNRPSHIARHRWWNSEQNLRSGVRSVVSVDVAARIPPGTRGEWSPWRTVVGFGVIRLHRGGHGVRRGSLGYRSVAGIARCIRRVGRAGQRRGRSHGAADACGLRIMGGPYQELLAPPRSLAMP